MMLLRVTRTLFRGAWHMIHCSIFGWPWSRNFHIFESLKPRACVFTWKNEKMWQFMRYVCLPGDTLGEASSVLLTICKPYQNQLRPHSWYLYHNESLCEFYSTRIWTFHLNVIDMTFYGLPVLMLLQGFSMLVDSFVSHFEK